MKDVEMKYKAIPFWSWNDKLEEDKLIEQIRWMKDQEIGGFFMHARGGLKTEYLSKDWFDKVKASAEEGYKLNMEAYAYDENGWPSGFAGGKLLDDIKNHDMYLTYSKGKYDPKALVSYIVKNNELIRVTSGDDCLNVYSHIAASTADILNKNVVKKFLNLTHEQYKINDPDHKIVGFFTDEPQYFRFAHAYTRVLPAYFKKKYNEDILDRLGLMFVEANGYQDFRYKYWLSMQTLMLNAFGKMTYEWCESNGYKMTGHYVEENTLHEQMTCCAGIMPFYEWEHIPGVDMLARDIRNDLPFKQVSSAAAQLGRNQVLTEEFGCCGWDCTPKEFKHISDHLYVNGINLMCQHLLPYSEYGQRKRDYPAHFSAINPWIRYGFRDFNYYFNVLGKMLATSKENIHVAIMHPIRSAYFTFKRDNEAPSTEPLDNSLIRLMDTLNANHIDYHFVDETLLERHGKVKGKSLQCGVMKYDTLILPLMYTMGKNTEKLLHKYVDNGGKVLLFDGKPNYLEGNEFDYDYLKSNITFEELKKKVKYTESTDNKDIKITYRTDEDGNPFLYVVNLLNKEVKTTIKFKGYRSFKKYDILNDSYKNISSNITLDAYEAMLLYPCNEKVEKENKLTKLGLGKTFEVVGKCDNYLTLDYLKYSKDGKNYSNTLYHMGVFDLLLKERYKGDLYLRYEFEAKYKPSFLQVLVENPNVKKVLVNGNEVNSIGVSEYEAHTSIYNIHEYVKTGKNNITVVMNYFQSEDVYYALFGENVTETLINCLVYNSNIEAIYLKGDFGVSGSFHENNECINGKDFKLVAPKKNIKSLIYDGYPFFGGVIKLKQEINVKNINRYLQLPERFQLANVYVNNKFASKAMFSNKVDVSKFLKPGKNIIEIEYCISYRNLFGPLHNNREDYGVGPWAFEWLGTWKDGISPQINPEYTFVRNDIR